MRLDLRVWKLYPVTEASCAIFSQKHDSIERISIDLSHMQITALPDRLSTVISAIIFLQFRKCDKWNERNQFITQHEECAAEEQTNLSKSRNKKNLFQILWLF